jgi:hypothetical protein
VDWGDLDQALNRFQAALRLLRFGGFIAKSANIIRHVRDGSLLFVVLFCLVFELKGSDLFKG